MHPLLSHSSTFSYVTVADLCLNSLTLATDIFSLIQTHQALIHLFQSDSRWWMKAGLVECSSRLWAFRVSFGMVKTGRSSSYRTIQKSSGWKVSAKTAKTYQLGGTESPQAKGVCVLCFRDDTQIGMHVQFCEEIQKMNWWEIQTGKYPTYIPFILKEQIFTFI